MLLAPTLTIKREILSRNHDVPEVLLEPFDQPAHGVVHLAAEAVALRRHRDELVPWGIARQVAQQKFACIKKRFS